MPTGSPIAARDPDEDERADDRVRHAAAGLATGFGILVKKSSESALAPSFTR